MKTMIRLRPSGADEMLIKRVRDWYEPGPGVFIAPQAMFNPAMLFTPGVNGAWHDPSDFSTMFQDAAGTTPVTAVGQPVGRILDKSGRGNHAFNPSGNSANFPVLQQDGTGRYYLAFNGVNQWLQTNSIDFTYGDKMFVSAGFRALNPSLYQVATELSASFSSNAGGFVVFKNGSNAQAWYFGSSGTVYQSVEKTGYPEPITNVVSGIGNIAGDQATLRVNGSQVASITADQGTGNYGNYPLYIGARAGSTLWFNGGLYGLVVAGKQASASEIASTEAWLNQKTGAY